MIIAEVISSKMMANQATAGESTINAYRMDALDDAANGKLTVHSANRKGCQKTILIR